MNKLLSLFAIVALTGCTTSSPDRDNQARISYDEFIRAMRAQGFENTDKNHDGSITWEEWQQLDTTPQAREHFDSLDTDRDGKINRQEWKAGLEKTGVSMKLFKQLDVDHNGYLGPAEMKQRPVSGLFSIGF